MPKEQQSTSDTWPFLIIKEKAKTKIKLKLNKLIKCRDKEKKINMGGKKKNNAQYSSHDTARFYTMVEGASSSVKLPSNQPFEEVKTSHNGKDCH